MCTSGDPGELHDHPKGYPGPAARYRCSSGEARPGGTETSSHPAGGRKQKVRWLIKTIKTIQVTFFEIKENHYDI